MEKTKVFPDTKYDNVNFAIFKVLDNGDKVPEFKPLVRFGVKKAERILKHIEELKQFVKDNS